MTASRVAALPRSCAASSFAPCATADKSDDESPRSAQSLLLADPAQAPGRSLLRFSARRCEDDTGKARDRLSSSPLFDMMKRKPRAQELPSPCDRSSLPRASARRHCRRRLHRLRWSCRKCCRMHRASTARLDFRHPRSCLRNRRNRAPENCRSTRTTFRRC